MRRRTTTGRSSATRTSPPRPGAADRGIGQRCYSGASAERAPSTLVPGWATAPRTLGSIDVAALHDRADFPRGGGRDASVGDVAEGPVDSTASWSRRDHGPDPGEELGAPSLFLRERRVRDDAEGGEDQDEDEEHGRERTRQVVLDELRLSCHRSRPPSVASGRLLGRRCPDATRLASPGDRAAVEKADARRPGAA